MYSLGVKVIAPFILPPPLLHKDGAPMPPSSTGRALQPQARVITSPVLLMQASPCPRNRCAYVEKLKDRQVHP